jgi:prefoldin subunit 5
LSENGVNDIIMALSLILSETGHVKLTILGDSNNEAESNSLDCVDNVTLLENKVQPEPFNEKLSGRHSLLPRSSSDPEFEGTADAGFDLKTTVNICSPEEYEQLKSEKTNLEAELVKGNEIIEATKVRLGDTENSLEDVTSKLADNEKWNSLSGTQLKCLAESYKSLESRRVELENEIEVLQSKIDTLTAELTDEKQSHREDLARYKDLEEKMER